MYRLLSSFSNLERHGRLINSTVDGRIEGSHEAKGILMYATVRKELHKSLQNTPWISLHLPHFFIEVDVVKCGNDPPCDRLLVLDQLQTPPIFAFPQWICIHPREDGKTL